MNVRADHVLASAFYAMLPPAKAEASRPLWGALSDADREPWLVTARHLRVLTGGGAIKSFSIEALRAAVLNGPLKGQIDTAEPAVLLYINMATTLFADVV